MFIRTSRHILPLLFLALLAFPLFAQQEHLVYSVDMHESVDKRSWHFLRKGFDKAYEQGATLIVLSINTYGGQVDMADSMRTAILNSPIPVWAFIDNQAASAGALIALACDSIYMRKGASMGAATVVTADGAAAPDKYQSFMRSMMRSTAQAKGKKQIVKSDGSVEEVYRRDPRIGEAMVDPSVAIEGIIDSGKILTLSTQEAIDVGFCEGQFESIREILDARGMPEAKIETYKPSGVDRVKGFFLSPLVSGILIMLIVGGIYFELQTPGVGFPLIVAIVAALAFFVPLYIDGLVQYLDIILFIAGIVLLLVEIFVIPGFGITGILGIIAVIAGLSLSLVDNELVFSWEPGSGIMLLRAVGVVVIALTLSTFGSILLGGALISSPRLPALALYKNLSSEEGFVGVAKMDQSLIGQEGVVETVLRPSGKVRVGEEVYDAISLDGIVEKETRVRVAKIETNQIYVRLIDKDQPSQQQS